VDGQHFKGGEFIATVIRGGTEGVGRARKLLIEMAMASGSIACRNVEFLRGAGR